MKNLSLDFTDRSLTPTFVTPRRDAPAKEIESLIEQTMSVSPDDLSDLARSRAETVQDELTEAYGIDPARVLVSTRPNAPRTRQVALQLE